MVFINAILLFCIAFQVFGEGSTPKEEQCKCRSCQFIETGVQQLSPFCTFDLFVRVFHLFVRVCLVFYLFYLVVVVVVVVVVVGGWWWLVVVVVLFSTVPSPRSDVLHCLSQLHDLDVPIVEDVTALGDLPAFFNAEADVIVDGIFGFSFQGEPRPPFQGILEALSSKKVALKVAIFFFAPYSKIPPPSLRH